MKILIADDANMIRNMLRRELSEAGHEVVCVNDGDEAISAFKKEPFDFVTLDVEIPGLNGFEVCEKIREIEGEQKAEKKTRVIFITNRDDVEGREKGFLVGGCDFIAKPFKPGDVTHVIKTLSKKDSRFEDLNVLVVEDSSMARKVIVQNLSELGVKVEEAIDGDDGLSRGQECP